MQFWRTLGGLLLAGALCAGASAEEKRIVGTWRLVSITVDGRVDLSRGPKPAGLIYYDAHGNMAAQVQPDRPRPESGYVAYFGTYTVDEKAGIVTHRRAGNLERGAPAVVQRRYEFVSDDRMILRPLENKSALTWERVK
jgi:hypothetical protein